MQRLVECVMNVSEGRRPEVLNELARSVPAGPSCALLDVHADPDHHRSVFTLAGEPEAVLRAALDLASHVVGRIDLRRHEGVHPRVGAVDVVPFVPLSGCALDDCAELARRFGRAFAEATGVPVFLYGAAADVAGGRELPALRRGGLPGLAAALQRGTIRPDFGPPRLHPSAGAAAVGARPILGAFNVEVEKGGVAAARFLARLVREQAGGLRGVRALGLELASRGVAQVSMNLVEMHVSPPATVRAFLAARAAEVGAVLGRSEVVGLLPRGALPADPAAELVIPDWSEDKVLEVRLEKLLAWEGGLEW
ncbi:MAG: glutamate formimidoyltransferase [Acidobacteriota bacterium]